MVPELQEAAGTKALAEIREQRHVAVSDRRMGEAMDHQVQPPVDAFGQDPRWLDLRCVHLHKERATAARGCARVLVLG